MYPLYRMCSAVVGGSQRMEPRQRVAREGNILSHDISEMKCHDCEQRGQLLTMRSLFAKHFASSLPRSRILCCLPHTNAAFATNSSHSFATFGLNCRHPKTPHN
jgi:hypothetical protein